MSKRGKVIFYSLVLFVLIIGARNYNCKVEKLKKNCGFTFAHIIEWSRTGDGTTKVRYWYIVKSVKYKDGKKGAYTPPGTKMKVEVGDKYYWVAYSKEDPSFNLINLKDEILDTLNAVKPSSFKHFK